MMEDRELWAVIDKVTQIGITAGSDSFIVGLASVLCHFFQKNNKTRRLISITWEETQNISLEEYFECARASREGD